MLANQNITEVRSKLFNVKNFVGDLEIIHSSVIHCALNDVIKTTLNDFSLNFIIIEDDKELRKLRLKDQSSSEITVEFVNFNENLGAGLLKPTSVFVINGIEIYFTFFIRSLDNGNQKEFTYTLLTKKQG